MTDQPATKGTPILRRPPQLLAGWAAAQQQRAASAVALAAWCHRYELPLAEAVAITQPPAAWRRALAVLGNPWLGGLLTLSFGAAARLQRGVAAMVREQQEGRRWAAGLRHLRRWLPAAYRHGAAAAEARGTLPAALPYLAPLLRDPLVGRHPLRFAYGVALLRLLPIMAIMAFYTFFAQPKLARLLQTVGETTLTWPEPLLRVWAAADWLLGYNYLFTPLFLLPFPLCHWLNHLRNQLDLNFLPYMYSRTSVTLFALAVYLYEFWLLRAFLRWVTSWGWGQALAEFCWLILPGAGAITRQQRAQEFVRAMHSALAAGQDWGAAASAYADGCPSWWYRPRVRRFAAAVQAGVRWDQAWLTARLTPPRLAWVIALSAPREQPGELLSTLDRLLGDQLACLVRRAELRLELGTTLLSALLVGLLAWVLVQQFAFLAQAIMDWPVT